MTVVSKFSPCTDVPEKALGRKLKSVSHICFFLGQSDLGD